MSLNGLRKLVFGSALYITLHAIYSVNVSARHARACYSASAMCFGGSRTSGSSLISRKFSWRIQNFGVISVIDSVCVFVSVVYTRPYITHFFKVAASLSMRATDFQPMSTVLDAHVFVVCRSVYCIDGLVCKEIRVQRSDRDCQIANQSRSCHQLPRQVCYKHSNYSHTQSRSFYIRWHCSILL